MTTQRTAPRLDRVDTAVTRIQQGEKELIQLLGDEDAAVIGKAALALALALAEIGPSTVGPLAAALPRASSARHKAALISALLTFGPQARVPVLRAFNQALHDERDPHVRAAAQSALSRLIVSDIVSSSTAAAGASRPSSPSPTRTAPLRP